VFYPSSINGFTLGGSAEGTRNFAAALDSTVFFRWGHTCHSALAAKLRTASNADAPHEDNNDFLLNNKVIPNNNYKLKKKTSAFG
jgi:hypothetical protein